MAPGGRRLVATGGTYPFFYSYTWQGVGFPVGRYVTIKMDDPSTANANVTVLDCTRPPATVLGGGRRGNINVTVQR